MASKQSTVDYLLEQIGNAGSVGARKMFGEYALYCDEQVIALVCDDKLYIKPTTAGKKFIKNIVEAPPYPGAKNYLLISEDRWEDRKWLTELVATTASELPLPKPKKIRRRG